MGMDLRARTFRHECSSLLKKVVFYLNLSMQMLINDNSYRTTLVDIVHDRSTPT